MLLDLGHSASGERFKAAAGFRRERGECKDVRPVRKKGIGSDWSALGIEASKKTYRSLELRLKMKLDGLKMVGELELKKLLLSMGREMRVINRPLVACYEMAKRSEQ